MIDTWVWKYRAFVKRVIQANELEVDVDLGFRIRRTMRVKLVGVDIKQDIADKARSFVSDLVENKKIEMETHEGKWRKGFWLADVFFTDADSQAFISLSQKIIRSGHGIAWES